MNHAVPETRMSTRQPFDLPIQGRLIGAAAPTVSQYRARPAQDAADAPLRDIVLFTDIIGSRSLLVWVHHFFFEISWSI